ncbi:hypothetical protein ACFQT0_04455 [Hymenobacter humi]|uniref:Uncharacterized protein n=1 Tax=Hymenobacter humi TaxID=1411620 RepID=A0ABW2U062_9BACT
MLTPVVSPAAPALFAKRYPIPAVVAGHLLLLAALASTLYCFGIIRYLPTNDNISRWDVYWYNLIREQGYLYSATSMSSAAFFPLFPYLWRLTGLDAFHMGLLNFGLFIAAFTWLAQQLRLPARWALLLLSTPPLLFMVIPYTEALFWVCHAAAARPAPRPPELVDAGPAGLRAHPLGQHHVYASAALYHAALGRPAGAGAPGPALGRGGPARYCCIGGVGGLHPVEAGGRAVRIYQSAAVLGARAAVAAASVCHALRHQYALARCAGALGGRRLDCGVPVAGRAVAASWKAPAARRAPGRDVCPRLLRQHHLVYPLVPGGSIWNFSRYLLATPFLVVLVGHLGTQPAWPRRYYFYLLLATLGLWQVFGAYTLEFDNFTRGQALWYFGLLTGYLFAYLLLRELRWQREVIMVLYVFNLVMQLHLLECFLQDYVVQ